MRLIDADALIRNPEFCGPCNKAARTAVICAPTVDAKPVVRLERERDAAVEALVLVSEKVEQAQKVLDTNIVHYVDFDIYLKLRNMVDDIMSWQYEDDQRGVKEE